MDDDAGRQHQVVGLIVAMEAELVHLRRSFGDGDDVSSDVFPAMRLRIQGQQVVAVRSGMGLINAAAATEWLIGRFSPTVVLNYGCSGAHRAEIMPGDLVIGDRVVHHSAMHVLPDGRERYRGFGYEVAGERMVANELASAPDLVALAESVAVQTQIASWPEELTWPAGVPRRPPAVHVGPVASADIWTQSTARLSVLHARHGTLCEDMEAAAIAQICAAHGLPFLTIKDISNNEYHNASDLERFSDFPTAEVGKRAAALMAAVIASLGAGRG